jgi:hypothetical protein
MFILTFEGGQVNILFAFRKDLLGHLQAFWGPQGAYLWVDAVSQHKDDMTKK